MEIVIQRRGCHPETKQTSIWTTKAENSRFLTHLFYDFKVRQVKKFHLKTDLLGIQFCLKELPQRLYAVETVLLSALPNDITSNAENYRHAYNKSALNRVF